MAYIADVVAATTITAAWGNSIRNQCVSTHATAAARDSAITSPAEGMFADLADDDILTRYNGSAWKIFTRGLLGGTKWTGGGNFVTGLTTTELACMTAASVTIPALATVEISVGMRLLGTVNADTFVFRLRETNVSGTQRGEFTWTCPSSLFGYNVYFVSFYENTNTASEAKVYCITAQRVGGTGSLSMIAGPSIHNTHIVTSIACASGVMTLSATP